jgi:hypothetical protein
MGVMRNFALAAAFGLAAAPLAASAAGAPTDALAKRVMGYTGDTDAAKASVPVMASVAAEHFAAGAAQDAVPVNAKSLDRAVRVQVAKYTPQFVAAYTRALTTVYSPDEMQQIIAWYRKPETRRGHAPAILADKAQNLAEQRAQNAAPLRLKLVQDVFTTYCGTAKTPCGEDVRQVIAADGHL